MRPTPEISRQIRQLQRMNIGSSSVWRNDWASTRAERVARRRQRRRQQRRERRLRGRQNSVRLPSTRNPSPSTSQGLLIIPDGGPSLPDVLSAQETAGTTLRRSFSSEGLSPMAGAGSADIESVELETPRRSLAATREPTAETNTLNRRQLMDLHLLLNTRHVSEASPLIRRRQDSLRRLNRHSVSSIRHDRRSVSTLANVATSEARVDPEPSTAAAASGVESRNERSQERRVRFDTTPDIIDS